MRNSFLSHFVQRCSKMKLEHPKIAKLFPNISLTEYDNKNLNYDLSFVEFL